MYCNNRLHISKVISSAPGAFLGLNRKMACRISSSVIGGSSFNLARCHFLCPLTAFLSWSGFRWDWIKGAHEHVGLGHHDALNQRWYRCCLARHLREPASFPDVARVLKEIFLVQLLLFLNEPEVFSSDGLESDLCLRRVGSPPPQCRDAVSG